MSTLLALEDNVISTLDTAEWEAMLLPGLSAVLHVVEGQSTLEVIAPSNWRSQRAHRPNHMWKEISDL